MTRYAVALAAGIALITSTHATGRELVAIKSRAVYYSAPATVLVTIAVEPDPQNRRLRLEADSATMFRSSEVDLSGAGDRRIHTIQFKGLPAGYYMLRAEVLSTEKVLATAEQPLIVSGR